MGKDGVVGRAAGGRDGAAVERELVRRDRDAVRGRVVHHHRVAAHHPGRVRGGHAVCRFRGAGKVKLQLRGAGDVDRRAEGHQRLDLDADAGGGGAVGDELDRRYGRDGGWAAVHQHPRKAISYMVQIGGGAARRDRAAVQR